MEFMTELLHRHPDYDPAHGRYEDMPTNEEVWAANSASFYDLVREGILTDTVENGVITKSKEEKFQAICERYGSKGRLDPEAEMRMVEINFQRLIARLARAGVPALYYDVVADERMNAAFSTGRGAYIYGESGVGKTTSACSLLKGWMKANPYGDPIFATSPQMLSEMRSTYGTGMNLEDVMLRYTKCPFLVIDDFGKEVLGEQDSARMWRVVNDRAADKRPTVITTELAVSELASRFDERNAASIGSRINGYYELFLLNGKDRRIA